MTASNTEVLAAALGLLPPSLEQPVARLNALYSHLPFDPVPLCQRISVWVNEWQVSEADVEAAIAVATGPEFMGKVQYNSELHAELAKLVQVAKDRRVDAERRQADEAKFQEQYVPPTPAAKRFVSQVVNGVIVTTAMDAPVAAHDDGMQLPPEKVKEMTAAMRKKWAAERR